MRALQAAGARESLTPQQLDTVRELAISGDDAELTDFLLSVLPPTVAKRVSTVLGVADEAVASIASPAPEVPVAVAKPKKAKKHGEETAAAKADEEKEDAAKDGSEDTTQPTDSDSGSDDNPDDDSKSGDDQDGDGTNGPGPLSDDGDVFGDR
jgi:hypothetical protein